MSYSDDWLKSVHASRQQPKQDESRPVVSPHWHHDDGSTTWKPWAKMTAEERRKALEKRDNTK